MKNFFASVTVLALLSAAGVSFAQTTPRKSLKLVDIFDAGQPQTVILKLYDPDAEVLCYVLMPEQAGRKMVDTSWVYDGNNIGSISCLKQIQYVVPIAIPEANQTGTAKPETSTPARTNADKPSKK